ncbi:hypothetical protein CLOM_g14994 [Closterium sp. NIES-68]|nr:hypothetical protein CLOM_g14994 [Closterium sp. NIES-68]GJP60382.1 hypothetical protein CLOP_g17593 [Closterium sp. NIES-67]
MSTSTSAVIAATSDAYEQSVAILTRLTGKWGRMEEEEANVRRAAEASKRLVDILAEREQAMASLIDRSQQVVSDMRERVGELQRDLQEDAERLEEVNEQKREEQVEIDALLEKVKAYQARIDHLVRKQGELQVKRGKLEADADFRTTKIRKELILFSGFTSIRLDLDVQDRFVGTMAHPSGSPELARPLDFDVADASTTTATAYQLWDML